MTTKVKVCGITNVEDALAAVDAGADALGFILAPEARARNRYLDIEEAISITIDLPPFVATVAVTVNMGGDDLDELTDLFSLVQLSGNEPEFMYADVRHRVIKVFHVGPDFSLDEVRDCPARALLLDTWKAGSHGGTGAVFDWDVAREVVELGKPVILAGGLTPDNVAEAVRRVRPFAVDVAGGVEASPGKKDHDKLRRFIRNAKEALAVS
jgi:phosphoribosylanthranilate isomerase